MLIELHTPSGKKQKLFALADTHGRHRQITVPGDVDTVIFAGDACEAGDHLQLTDFFAWFAALPAGNKLFVPGNHDLPFEFAPDFAKSMVPQNVIFLEDDGVTLDGVRFYSLPVRPWMHNESYLPSGVDVLITHGAPAGLLDAHTGCPTLRKLVALARPKNHIFGHVHQTGGQSVQEDRTMFWNAAVKQL
ncbi:MAG: metallophosphoesterase [Dysgonamonadaceae bacterium]|jgi:predicted phosphohydrolase|nr:metallophosphoesterase [Dysgonamonadaceae bacterium]